MADQQMYDVFSVDPGGAKSQHHLVGRFLLDDGSFEPLADYFGYLSRIPSGPLTEESGKQLRALQNSPYFRVVDRSEMAQGQHPDLLPEAEFPGAPPDTEMKPASVWTYHHPIMQNPQTLEARGSDLFMNGQLLSAIEAHRIMENIRSKVAKVRYKLPAPPSQVLSMPQAIAKAEAEMVKLDDAEKKPKKVPVSREHLKDDVCEQKQMIDTLEDGIKRDQQALAKAIDPALATALSQIKTTNPEAHRVVSRHIFVDPMVEGIGNKKAYEDFLSRPRAGVHVRLDANDFGSINKIHSFEHGNNAIKAMGNAVREARDEVVGQKNGKVFRIGGDEFHVHVPSHEHAARFMRALRGKLEALPPVGGTHALSFSAGFGRSAEEADAASIQAKKAKKEAGYPMGQAKTHAYSAIPGNEGHVPLGKDPLPAPPPVVSPATAPVEAPKPA